jgi:hypothetical protein
VIVQVLIFVWQGYPSARNPRREVAILSEAVVCANTRRVTLVFYTYVQGYSYFRDTVHKIGTLKWRNGL